MHPGAECVGVERVPLGIKELLGGHALGQEPLAELVGACGPASFCHVRGAGSQGRPVLGKPDGGRLRIALRLPPLRIDREHVPRALQFRGLPRVGPPYVSP